MEQLVTLQHGQVNYTGPETLIQFRVKSVEAGRTGTGFLMVDIVLQRMFYYHLVRTLSMHRIALPNRVIQIPVRMVNPGADKGFFLMKSALKCTVEFELNL